MQVKDFIISLGFKAKDGTEGVFIKKYASHSNYAIEVDFAKETINYGNQITCESKTTQNFSQPENFVVLECVDRLLTKGYKAKDITLEKTYPSGHGHSGRLDVLVKKDKKAFLMIECKTWGAEFEKGHKKIQKDGGQLFTYFQNDTNADYLMLYASHLTGGGMRYRCEIIKIEDNYRTAGNVEDTFARWSKLTYSNGIFEDWVNAYEYQNKLLTKKDLVPLTESDSGAIFNGFLSILRKHSVSDKPNAFNKIFNLFLAKIYDEKKRDTDELEFQWKEKEDDPVEFQVRLINLHKQGLFEFLRKEIVGISDEDFEATTAIELYNKKKERLKFNKIFDIKDVIDDESFDDNFRVLKEVVQLLEKYQIRYPRKQQHLSDFFERLLTTGLKQEAGQFFTPPPITKFIVRSLPIKEMIESEANQPVTKLPAVIDYAAGSGHFITEIMEAYQDTINNIDAANYFPDAQNEIAAWKTNPYSWAAKYVYGIEKDYRLVKVAKVGCYFYGDGLAQIIHGDGLDSFTKSKSYVGLLKENKIPNDSTKAQFSIVISNPPYSVDAFKGDLRNIDAGKDFSLYGSLTDKSKEIECLFVERTKQLLKDKGIAGIVLPSSILSNTGIYTKTRDIILQNFDIVAITELGANTFMATPTNTVILFLRRKNGLFFDKTKAAVNVFLSTLKDATINEIETPIAKYVNSVWEGLSYKDYLTLLKKTPNEIVQNHEIYKDYKSKIKAKNNDELWNTLLCLESEKILYYIIAYPQKMVLVKSGDKDARKNFLGFEFSNRRGNEGIHPAKRGETIEKCTKLFDPNELINNTKASTYIYKAFQKDYSLPIDESLKNNVSYINLVDAIGFNRATFEKTISLAVKKKNKIDSKWEQVNLENALCKVEGSTAKVAEFDIQLTGLAPVVTQETTSLIAGYSDKESPITDVPIVLFGDHSCAVKYIDFPFFRGADGTVLLKPKKDFNVKYFYYVLKLLLVDLIENKGKYERHNKYLKDLYIPLPPKNIQEKIIADISKIENKEEEAKIQISESKRSIDNVVIDAYSKYNKIKLDQITTTNPSKAEVSYLDNNDLISFIEMSSISNDGYVETKVDMHYSQVKKGSYTYFKEEDIIVAKITPCMENGKCALAMDLTNNIGFGSSEFHVFRTNKDILLPKYLFTLLNRKTIREEAEENMTGASGHRRVPISFYEQLEIPVPSIAEQQKIISEIEMLENQVEEARNVIEMTLTLKGDILKKYL